MGRCPKPHEGHHAPRPGIVRAREGEVGVGCGTDNGCCCERLGLSADSLEGNPSNFPKKISDGIESMEMRAMNT